MRVERRSGWLVALALLALPVPAGASERQALEIVRDHVDRDAASLGLSRSDLADVVVSSSHTDADTATTHVYLQQRHRGIPVDGAILNASVGRDGNVITVGNRFVGGLAAQGSSPALSAAEGVAAAARAVGLRLEQPALHSAAGGRTRKAVFGGGGIASEPIPAELRYVRDGDGGVRLAWHVLLREIGDRHWWEVATDAATGALLARSDRVRDAGTYNVFATPVEAPTFGARSLVASPADPLASPYGWHDTNGVDGPESTKTSGNNAEVGAASAPDGTGALAFDFPLDLTQDPDDYGPALHTNAFYWVNRLHDVLYHHGFTEAAGNMQASNYGRGGLGGDPVEVQFAQNDGSFMTFTPDGTRSQMTLGTRGASPRRTAALDAGLIAHEYGHGLSSRLVGGGGACLDDGNIGEGWSDFLALVTTARGAAPADETRGAFTYYLGQPPDGPGARGLPYSTDMTINPWTYADSFGSPQVHFTGSRWAAILWEVHWNLVRVHGFNPDVSGDWRTGGNNLALRLMVDALKMTPCEPGFVDGRDAFLAADLNLTGGANRCAIWRGFAKRGLGAGAVQDASEAFDLPSACSTPATTTDPPPAGQSDAGDGEPVLSPPGAPRLKLARRAVTVNAKRLATLGTLTCPAGPACTVTAPRRVTVTIARRRYRLTVIVARTVRAGGSATVKVRLPKPAAKRLRGRRARVVLGLTAVAGGERLSRTIRVTIRR